MATSNFWGTNSFKTVDGVQLAFDLNDKEGIIAGIKELSPKEMTLEQIEQTNKVFDSIETALDEKSKENKDPEKESKPEEKEEIKVEWTEEDEDEYRREQREAGNYWNL